MLKVKDICISKYLLQHPFTNCVSSFGFAHPNFTNNGWLRIHSMSYKYNSCVQGLLRCMYYLLLLIYCFEWHQHDTEV